MNMKDLIKRNGLFYKKFTDVPFNGEIIGNQQGSFTNGLKNGNWVRFFENGQLKSKGNFVNGTLNGIWEFFNQNGTLIRKQNYLYGKIDGELKIFHKNGNLKVEKFYINSFLEGMFDYFDEVGKLYKIETWEKGILIERGHYENGIKEGYCFYKKEIDVILHTYEGNYKNDFRNGLWTELIYEFDDSYSQLVGNYLNGKKEGLWKNYYIKDDEKKILSRTTSFKNDKEDGPYKSYDEFGDVINSGNYKKGNKFGKWIEYQPYDYVNKILVNYNKEGELDGLYMEYDSQGKIICEGSYKDGLLHGNWKKYDWKTDQYFETFYEDGESLDH